MAKQEHLKILQQGVEAWNKWRSENPDLKPDLTGATLVGAKLPGADLAATDLTQAELTGANLSRTNFMGAILTEAKLTRANLRKANLRRADLRKANLIETKLTGANLIGAQLTGAKLRKADLIRANLIEAYLIEARFTQAKLTVANLTKAKLRKADLIEADLKRAKLTGTNLTGANLAGANLGRTDLTGANLTEAKLKNTNLIETDLTGANLTRANLTGANLTGANLSNTNLTQARFTGASLVTVSFLRANLTNVVLAGEPELTQKQNESYRQGDIKVEKDQDSREAIYSSDPTVAGAKFGMANLTGARLPALLNNFQDALKSVEETSKNARGILLALVAICSFALLTATTITDLQLVLNGTRLKLPIINTEVPVIPFSVSVPILGLLVFIYLHMYLAHLHELLADLPALFPDGVPLRRKLYPWMMNLLIEEWQFPSTEEEWQLTRIKDKSITHKTLMDRLIDLLAIWFRFNRFRSMFAILLGWALLPMTSFTIAYRFLARHDSTLSYILLGLSTFSVFIASLVYQRARATVKSEKVGLLRGLTPIVLSTIILFAGLKVTNSGINGELPGTTQNMSFSNLANKELRRINLRKADLRGADLSNTDLHSADLFNANLKGAYLGDARLDSANLEGADLRGAKGLTAEQLYKAKTLFDAKLESTLLEQIRKEYPDLLKKIRSSEQ